VWVREIAAIELDDGIVSDPRGPGDGVIAKRTTLDERLPPPSIAAEHRCRSSPLQH
jgi:hypothetical protein